MVGVLIKRRHLDTETDTQRKGHVKRHREKTASYTPRNARGYQREEGMDSPSKRSEKTYPWPHLDLRLLASRSARQCICYLKPPRLWSFIPAASGN